MKLRRFSPVFLAGALCLLLSGCFVKTVDELYTLPRHSDEYDNLQMAIDEVMAADGCSYSAPVSGSNQQSVQLADLDGDGEEEAIVFARTAGEKPLKAYVFDKKDGAYQNVAVIEGNGTAFARVEYVDLDGETGQEILIGRQLTDQVLQSVSAYALENGEIVELMTASYSQFTTCDLDNDGRADLFVLRFDAETRRGAAELYRYRNDQMQRGPEVSLAHDAASVKRIMTGAVAYNIPAVFVTSACEEDTLETDVFIFRGGTFQNLSSLDETPQTVRNPFAYACDINSDGLVELPELVSLPAADAVAETYSLIRWYRLGLDGSREVVLRTYHRFSGGWYVEIPESWDERITISRADEVEGARGGLVFSSWNGSAPAEPIFTIYAFTGDRRMERAQQDGWFLLLEQTDAVYSASLGTANQAKNLTQDELRQMFHIIHVDWNSGET